MPTSAPVPWSWLASDTRVCSRWRSSESRVRALLGLHRLGDPAAAGEPSDVVRRLDEADAELRGKAT